MIKITTPFIPATLLLIPTIMWTLYPLIPSYVQGESVTNPVVIADNSDLNSEPSPPLPSPLKNDTPTIETTPSGLPPTQETHIKNEERTGDEDKPSGLSNTGTSPEGTGGADTPARGCRITQTEESHHLFGNGSVYAIDLHCEEKGKAGDSYFPTEKSEYQILAIGQDDRLGDYIIIKHGDLRWVYGHTVTSRKQGDFIKVTDTDNVLGQENKSGMWNGYHVHIEKWKCPQADSPMGHCKNVSSTGEENTKTDKLLEQRGWVVFPDIGKNPTVTEIAKVALPLIRKYEGLHLKAYQDGSRCSIGYGSRATSCSQTTTKEQAEKWLENVVVDLINKTVKKKPGLTANQYAALVSLGYNCNSGYKHVMNGGEWATGLCTSAQGKVLKGLQQRRAEELALYY